MQKIRCPWAKESNPNYIKYHDEEWGVPMHEENTLFEFLVLEAFQAGLSWEIILNKRKAFKDAFEGFDPGRVALFDEKRVFELTQNANIIRNKLKINAAVNNAIRFCEIQSDFGSFDSYIWSFVEGKPITNHWKQLEQIPANTKLSDKISKDLKQRGFKFMGSTVVYSHMQATGMVNDHLVDCFRYLEVQKV